MAHAERTEPCRRPYASAALAAVVGFFLFAVPAAATESSPSFQNDGSLYWSAGNSTSSSFHSAESGYYTSGSGTSASFVESGGNPVSFTAATSASTSGGNGGSVQGPGGSTTYLAYLHIDGGAPMTSSAGVTLSLNANFTPVTMIVARRPDFLDGVALPFQPAYFPWMLCGQPSCAPGTYAVYVRLVGGSGIGVDVAAAINLITNGFTGPQLPVRAAPGSRSPASGQPNAQPEPPAGTDGAQAPGGSVPSISTGSPPSGAAFESGGKPSGNLSKPRGSSTAAVPPPSAMPLRFLLYGFGGLVLLMLLLLWRAKRA